VTKKKVLTLKHFAYVLKSQNHWRFYVGMTTNIEKRVDEHNRGYTKSTKAYAPWVLFFFEEYETREEARMREIYLKSGVGKERINELWSLSSTAFLPTGRDRASD
jgi:putative endonuclease